MNLQFIFSSLYFFLPAYFVNMTPPLVKRIKIFEKRVDFNRNFKGKPIFGAHKTWRGVIFGFLVGFFIVLFQKFLYQFSFFQKISLIDYSQNDVYLLAVLLPLGAIFGDLCSAFFKRRLDLPPGTPFIPWDQTNYVIGAFIFVEPFFHFKITIWLLLFVLTFFLHLFFNYLGYLLKIHQAKL